MTSNEKLNMHELFDAVLCLNR